MSTEAFTRHEMPEPRPIWAMVRDGGAGPAPENPVRNVWVERVRQGRFDGALGLFVAVRRGGDEEPMVCAMPLPDEWWAGLTAALMRELGGDMSRFIPTSAASGLLLARDMADVAAFERGEWR